MMKNLSALLDNKVEGIYHYSHRCCPDHYNDVIMGAIAPQITSLTIVFPTFYLDTDQRKHQSSAPLAFVRGAGDR